MPALSIRPLEPQSPWSGQIAARQHAHWGSLTGHDSVALYELFLEQAARSTALPRVLIATSDGALLGSVNLLMTEMTIRPQLSPWMSQLFVFENRRAHGIGAALQDAAAAYAGSLGYRQIFLFTSGTLPAYYRRLGWIDIEEVAYLGKVRTIMRRDIQ